MTETSREGFVPRHLRGRQVGPATCSWRTIAVHDYRRPDESQTCNNPIDTRSGVNLCPDHIRRIGLISGLMTRKRAQEWITSEHENRIDLLRAENERLRRTIAWQARRLRGDDQPDTPPAPKQGTIYALLSGYNVKVGWTGRDLQARLREYPPSTQLLVHFPGVRGDETRIKRKFAHLRTHGNEWFPYAPQVTEWVAQMVHEHGDPDPDITCGPAKYETPRPHSQQSVVKPRYWRGKTA